MKTFHILVSIFLTALLAPYPAVAELPDFVDVFSRDTDGYPHIRIPAIVRSQGDALLAFAEGRQRGDHSENDIILKRSLDDGKTWLPVQVLAEMGGDSLNDPCALALRSSGRVLLSYQRYPKGYHTRKMEHTEMADLGYDGPTNTQSFLLHSDDDGATWSAPRDVTRQFRRPDAISVGSPGIAIELKQDPHAGRIVWPLFEVIPHDNFDRGWRNAAALSDDGGQTWRLSERVPGEVRCNECQIAERADGVLVMSARAESGEVRRKTSISRDGGQTWSPMQPNADIEAPSCMASLLASQDQNGKEVLLLSAPNSPKSRVKGSVFISRDGGQSWPEKRRLYPKGWAYSCLVPLPKNKIGCLFERDATQHISYMVFDAP